MAIAFNAAADGGNNNGSGNLTFSYTCSSGSNRLLIVAVLGDTNADTISGVTYNGVSLTLAAKQNPNAQGSNRWTYLFYLLGPATGANNVVASGSGYVEAVAADYTGVSQSGQPDATETLQGALTGISTLTSSITTVANNSWAILTENGYDGNDDNQPATAGTGLTLRTFDATYGALEIFDSNGAITPAGSYSMTTNRGSSDSIIHVAASFSPASTGDTFANEPPMMFM